MERFLTRTHDQHQAATTRKTKHKKKSQTNDILTLSFPFWERSSNLDPARPASRCCPPILVRSCWWSCSLDVCLYCPWLTSKTHTKRRVIKEAESSTAILRPPPRTLVSKAAQLITGPALLGNNFKGYQQRMHKKEKSRKMIC